MIGKVGLNNVSFGRTYLINNDATKKVMDKDRRYLLNGKSQPFPEENFNEVVKVLNKFSEDYECDVYFAFKDNEEHKDQFDTTVKIYDQRERIGKPPFYEGSVSSGKYDLDFRTPFYDTINTVKQKILEYKGLF